MKTSGWTRFLALCLAVISLSMLVSGGLGIRAANRERLKDESELQDLRSQIDEYREISAALMDRASYEQLNQTLDEKQKQYNTDTAKHRADLSTYTATNSGLEMGTAALNQAESALETGKTQYEMGRKALRASLNAFAQIDSVIGPIQTQSETIRDILYSFEDKVDSQSSSVDSARQRLDSATENLDKYTITAPIEGRVISKNYKVGDKIGNNSGQSNSSTSLATIYDMSEYTFRMSIDETDITRIEVGQEVEVSAEAFDGENFSGTVTGISLESSVSNGVSTYPVEVTMSDTEKLLPGMNVDAEIVTSFRYLQLPKAYSPTEVSRLSCCGVEVCNFRAVTAVP